MIDDAKSLLEDA